jgi:hypothetical protein
LKEKKKKGAILITASPVTIYSGQNLAYFITFNLKSNSFVVFLTQTRCLAGNGICDFVDISLRGDPP